MPQPTGYIGPSAPYVNRTGIRLLTDSYRREYALQFTIRVI
jgi:hypothetical protein